MYPLSVDADAAELLATWHRLSESERSEVLAAIVSRVDTKLRESPFYPNRLGAKPHVDVYGSRQELAQGPLTVHFVAHYLMYCFAQSGSDWAEHLIMTGEATFERASIIAASLTLVSASRLSESEFDAYDENRPVTQLRDAAIAKLLGGG